MLIFFGNVFVKNGIVGFLIMMVAVTTAMGLTYDQLLAIIEGR